MVLTKFQLSEFPLWLHRADTCATRPDAAAPLVAHRLAPRQVSALFRPRPSRTRQLCRPLHSAALIRCGERRCGSHLRGAFRFVPTAANRRDRPQIGRTQRNNSRMSRGSARHEQAIARDASHGQDTAIRREAPPVAEDTVVGREASPGQDNRQ